MYLHYLYAICCTFICYAHQNCYNKGMDARQVVTLSILALCIQVRLLVESKASTDHYSYTCTQAVRNTVSSCFGIVIIVVSHNIPTKTSSGSMPSHRYFSAYKYFHGVVVSYVCLSWLLIFSLALSSIFCGAAHCNLCVHACMDPGYGSRRPFSRQSDSALDLRGTSAAYVYLHMWTFIRTICMHFLIPSSVTLGRAAITRAWMWDSGSQYPLLQCAFKFVCLFNPKLVQISTPIYAHKLLEAQRHHVLGSTA